MTEKIYLSPIASPTVDAKLSVIMDAIGMEMEHEDAPDIRSLKERNDLGLENTEDAPYS